MCVLYIKLACYTFLPTQLRLSSLFINKHMKGYKAYNYHSYILGSSETLSPHVLLNLVGGVDP